MTSSQRFQKLMEPGYIGKIRTKNRILRMGATPGFYTYQDGYVQQQVIEYYEALARGGVGLITVGGTPRGLTTTKGYRVDDDKYIPGLSRITKAIRKHDCYAFLQLFHIGPNQPVDAGVATVAASSLKPNELPLPNLTIPRELSITEIKELVQIFGEDAARAKKAGFQGIEVNAGCNHLLNSFLSRAWNKRQDEYGIGSLENRARIMVEIIQGIKRRNGDDFPVTALINGAEPGLEKGITSEESQEFARILQAAGADAIHVRVEFYSKPKDPSLRSNTHFPDIALYPETPYPAENIDTSRHGAGAWVPLAAAIKKVVSIPVIAVGRLDPELAEKLLRRGMADYVNFNRRLMADPELPNKIAEGRLEDIAPCTACMTCWDTMKLVQPPRCQVNTALGKEKEYEIKPAVKKKRVVVIGGGPAGMEAARVTALESHQVILFEKKNSLGGAVNMAAVVNRTQREDLLALVNYLKTQIKKAGVDIRVGIEVSKEVIQELKPDVIIVAGGGKHALPDIPGISNKKMTTKYVPKGDNIVIIGGNIQGCQTAEFLTKRGRKVTIVESGPIIGKGLGEFFLRTQLLDWLNKKDVPMMTNVKYEQITDEGLSIITKEGKKQTLKADTVLITLLQPNLDLFYSLQDVAAEVYAIGDCKEPRLIVDAIADGASIARAI